MDKVARGLFWTAVVLVVVGVVGRLLFVDAWTVPEDRTLVASIVPTLHEGDFLLVSRHGSVGFGDLVRCTDPETPGGFVVGRIAGLGGDQLEVAGRSLTVNNRRFNSEQICLDPKVIVVNPTTGDDMTLQCDTVHMGSVTHMRAYRTDHLFAPDTKIATVAADRVYLVSDDRDFHEDSRDFGMLRRDSCSRILFRLWGKQGWTDDKARLTLIN
jgi:signal peptidase I